MPPAYDFKCPTCDELLLNQVLRITHTIYDLPTCCNSPMGYHITSVPMVHWKDPNIEPFRSVATKDRPIISTSRERREYMAKNDLLDANEVCEPPSQAEVKMKRQEIKESIEAITPSGAVKEDLTKRGLMDIVK
jgi:hypothetical protein